ncbi:uncharacterized protein [Phaseolus vulgaris]|uniref:uncharacterized protein n=1 Tax=Phaseolus vulgaris TaxID=3885 RepID=UPI0035CC645F
MDETIFSEPLNYSKDKFPNKPSFVPNLMGRMISWSVELFEFNIKYDPRGPIKSQCLTNFVVDLGPKSVDPNNSWVLHVDGPSNTKGSEILNTFQPFNAFQQNPKPQKPYIPNLIFQSIFQIPNPKSTHTLVVFFECFHGLVLLRFLLPIHVLLKLTVVVVFFFALLRCYFEFNPGCSGYIGCIGKDKFGEEMKKRCSLDGVKVHYYEILHLWELVLFVWLVVKGHSLLTYQLQNCYKSEHLIKPKNWALDLHDEPFRSLYL